MSLGIKLFFLIQTWCFIINFQKYLSVPDYQEKKEKVSFKLVNTVKISYFKNNSSIIFKEIYKL